jgi:hypothetical protein
VVDVVVEVETALNLAVVDNVVVEVETALNLAVVDNVVARDLLSTSTT